MNEALTKLGRVVMTLRPKTADKLQTKEAVLAMATDIITHLEKKARNSNPAALSSNRESVIKDNDLDEKEPIEPVPLPALGGSPLSPALETPPICPPLETSSSCYRYDDLDEQEPTEPDQVPLPALGASPLSPALGASSRCHTYYDLDGQPRQIHYRNYLHAPGSFPPGLRNRTYASPLSPALRASRRPPALEKSPIWPALGASSMYPVFVPSTLSPALGASPALEASTRPPALETSPICPALGASPRLPALTAATLSPAMGASPRSANQNDSNPISYEDQKWLDDLSESREASFDILGWPQKVMGYLSSLIQSDDITSKNTGKSAEKID